MSDDDALAAVTVTAQLLATSHKQVQQTVQPSDAKRNADDADWSSSLSNLYEDLDHEDTTKTVHRGGYYQPMCHQTPSSSRRVILHRRWPKPSRWAWPSTSLYLWGSDPAECQAPSTFCRLQIHRQCSLMLYIITMIGMARTSDHGSFVKALRGCDCVGKASDVVVIKVPVSTWRVIVGIRAFQAGGHHSRRPDLLLEQAQTAMEPEVESLWREAVALSIEDRLRHAAGLPTTSETPASGTPYDLRQISPLHCPGTIAI
ncbi:hypothetical protein DFJ58DRAFT_843643 [Suillus subalutaceus]|uniref:uncharacterized protein n=1 Tax=Suillus subalutaceus TaxID=48586 RepID=UPI001B87CA6D|nr:uncharacterized protein DFJ58DRAFT_843643 [Suillus subalutaceus]KAG1845889.1 hypothetical protein DFJ58DRAFT_843643 [Suillus subalutaceus]